MLLFSAHCRMLIGACNSMQSDGMPDARLQVDNLNAMNAAVHPIIRKANPSRVVFYGGLQVLLTWA